MDRLTPFPLNHSLSDHDAMRAELVARLTDEVMDRVPTCRCGLVAAGDCDDGCLWPGVDMQPIRRKAVEREMTKRVLLVSEDRVSDARLALALGDLRRVVELTRLENVLGEEV